MSIRRYIVYVHYWIVSVATTNKTGNWQTAGVRESFSIAALKSVFSKGKL